jgi:hypothetical protein
MKSLLGNAMLVAAFAPCLRRDRKRSALDSAPAEAWRDEVAFGEQALKFPQKL